MKLTPAQLEEVESLVQAQNLKFKDFEAEMVDHVCTAIEQMEESAIDFNYEINRIVYSFDEHFEEVKGIWQSGKFYTGMRAVEQRHFAVSQKRILRLLISSLKSQLLSWKVLIWMSLFYLLTFVHHPYSWSTFDSFSEGFLEGIILSACFFLVAFLFSNETFYDPETDSIWKYFPRIYKRFFRPKSVTAHSLVRVILIPVLIFLVFVELNYFLTLPQIVNTAFVWFLLLVTWCTFEVYQTKILKG
ncbi:hypothetical protein [Jiulongibacter sp. NS-SX5]|uniref:hypothetical protein n=1 Tax=Jiulongibacter sp. NS-SX5 TaxID=3463854 RepID=UPI0040597ACF